MLPIGTLIRNLNAKLIRERPNIDYAKDGLIKGNLEHDLIAHILGGALLTDQGEPLACVLQTLLSPEFKEGEEKIINMLSNLPEFRRASKLTEEEVDAYTSMVLRYRAIYRMDGTNQLVEKILNSPKQKGKYDNHKPSNSRLRNSQHRSLSLNT